MGEDPLSDGRVVDGGDGLHPPRSAVKSRTFFGQKVEYVVEGAGVRPLAAE